MALNPEQFGLEVSAAPWAGVRQMASRAIGPMGVVRPIIASMEQIHDEQLGMFLGQKVDVRKTPSPVASGMNFLPNLPPGRGRAR